MTPTPITDREAVHDDVICERNYNEAGWVPADVCREIERDKNQLLMAFAHRHDNNGTDDACARCGLDLRNPVHAVG